MIKSFFSKHMWLMVTIIFIIVVFSAIQAHRAAKNSENTANALGVGETTPATKS